MVQWPSLSIEHDHLHSLVFAYLHLDVRDFKSPRVPFFLALTSSTTVSRKRASKLPDAINSLLVYQQLNLRTVSVGP